MNLNINNEGELDQRIGRLKEISDLGVTLLNFVLVLSNLSNGHTQNPETWNNFTIDEWVAFFANQFRPIEVSNEQIELIFNYIRDYHVNIINRNGDRYRSSNRNNINFDQTFFF